MSGFECIIVHNGKKRNSIHDCVLPYVSVSAWILLNVHSMITLLAAHPPPQVKVQRDRISNRAVLAWAHPSWGQSVGWMSLSLSCPFCHTARSIIQYRDGDWSLLAEENHPEENTYKYANERQNKHQPANEPSINDQFLSSSALAQQHQSAPPSEAVMERLPLNFSPSVPPPYCISFTYCLLFIGSSLPFFMQTFYNFLPSLSTHIHSLDLKHFVSTMLAFFAPPFPLSCLFNSLLPLTS